jgi:hypothetical protein
MKNKYLALIVLGLSAMNSQAVITVSFLTDTWNYAVGSPTLGFVNQTAPSASSPSAGSVTKDGVTLNFSATFVGGAQSGTSFSAGVAPVGSSMTNAGPGQNPPGFLLSTVNNDSAGLTEGIAANPTTGTVSSYQRWHFEFSEPVYLHQFFMKDIDNNPSNTGSLDGGTGSFRDILGAEAWTTRTPGPPPTAGTGFDPTIALDSATLLTTSTLGLTGGGDLVAIYPIVNTGNPASTANVNALIYFGASKISAFSVYAISNNPNVHRMSLDQSSFSFDAEVVPEPSASALGVLAMGGMLLRRRR